MIKKIAMVTGSAQGIGQAIATNLTNAGYSVIGIDIKDQPDSACTRTICADLADPKNLEHLFRETGTVDILINNAAILIEKPISQFSVADFDTTIAVNFRAFFLLSKLAAIRMKDSGWGRIVNISSIGARTGGLSDSAVYSGTKAAMIALTKSFARQYGPYGINTNAVAPGGIDTPMVQRQFERDLGLRERVISQIPLQRLGTPAEIASVVKFLCSDDASFVNGVTIDVNGGWVMT